MTGPLKMQVIKDDGPPLPVVHPSNYEGIDGWVNRIAKSVIRLGGDPDAIYRSEQVRDYLHALKPSVYELPMATNNWRRRNFANLWPELSRIMLNQALGIRSFVTGVLTVAHRDPNGDMLLSPSLASLRVVTNVGVGKIVDAFDVGVGYTLSNFNYHGIGTGAVAEAVGDTALGTELTTEYNPNSTRATGTQSQPSANVYRSLGTNAVDAAVAITEHGLLSQAATGGGDLWDRSVFAVINLSSGDSLQTTYDATFPAGS